MVGVQCGGDFAVAVPLAAQIKYACHHGSGHRVDNKDVLILRAFQIADGRVAADIFPGLESRLLDGSNLVTGVTGIEVVHDIFQNDQHLIIFVDRIHTVVECDKAAAQ